MPESSITRRLREVIAEARKTLDAERKNLDRQERILDQLVTKVDDLDGPPATQSSKTSEPPKVTRKVISKETPAMTKSVVLGVLGKAYPKGLRIEELEKQTSLERDALKSALGELITSGDVEKEGKARGVRYSIPGVPAAKPTGNVKKIAPRRGHSYPWEGEAA